ncbi:5-oxoprolinase [Alicyclobacillus acidoterrestris]|nr:5-oxoprolinase [Alicyclobacillus acidoterrestris]
MSILMGVDIGGTFTDLIGFDEQTGQLLHAKRPTTYFDLVQGIVDCTAASGLDMGEVSQIVHGSTIAINTVIEETGACTALITTRGTRDIYRIGRGNRPDAYDFFFHRPRPLVPRHLTFEVTGRMLANGDEWTPIDEGEIEALCETLSEQKVEAVAVCFLHSYANPAHEERVGKIIRLRLPDCYVSLSHEILRAYREYERTSTTVLNAYVGPKVSRYINELSSKMSGIGFAGHFSIMQSNGGVMAPEMAAKRPVNMMESGPVGGIIASAEIGRSLGYTNVIAFDMGGTTAKASLIRAGEVMMSEMYYIGGYASGHPVMIPVVDVVEVGTGGGSIAWIDEVGTLRVGPQSAGADPAPICYGKGGCEPTFTDAFVVLGRVGAQDFLGGDLKLDELSAIQGIQHKLADVLHIGVYQAAQAVIQIAINNMSLAVRQVSVEKGYDPREFALVASGGAGPLSALAVARELHIPTVIIPRFPAHFSAIGMLLTDEKHDFVRTYYGALEDVDFEQLVKVHDDMLEEVRAVVRSESMTTTTIVYQTCLDVRYVGQEFTLSVPVSDEQLRQARIQEIHDAFDNIHQQRFGHQAPHEPVEMVNIRLTAIGVRNKPKFQLERNEDCLPHVSYRKVFFEDAEKPIDCPVYERDSLPPNYVLAGPALVQEYASTTVLYQGDTCTVSQTGELVISVGGGQDA